MHCANPGRIRSNGVVRMTVQTRRKYRVTLELELDVSEEAITRTQTQEWRDQMYDLTEADSAAMIARCLYRGISLSKLDGWADLPDSDAHVEFISEEAYADDPP